MTVGIGFSIFSFLDEVSSDFVDSLPSPLRYGNYCGVVVHNSNPLYLLCSRVLQSS
jgi:hypothetical protein